MQSLFTPLQAEGLTTLKLRYNWKNGKSSLFAARQWDAGFNFSGYNKDFYVGSSLTENEMYLNDAAVRDLFNKHGLADYLESVIDLLRQGKHFGMDCYFHAGENIRFMGNLHSKTSGINNKMHAILSGGIRRHGLEDNELDVIVDGLNLARAMSFKNIAAEIPYGGCKTTVHMQPLELTNMDVMGFLAYSLDSIRCFTGPDMNFPTEMADVMRENFSKYFTGGPKGPLGETGKPTAYGVYLALKEAVRFETGTASLAGKTIAVQGLGAVGYYMAKHLLEEDITLLVTDVDKNRADAFIAEHAERAITYIKPEEMLTTQADIFCPSAIGGIFDDNSIEKLNFKIIIGGANNQLKASSQEEEIRLADKILQRGILFQEAWWHNIAGVLCGEEEYRHGDAASYARLTHRIEETVPRKTWANLTAAKNKGISPTECAYNTCEALIYK